MSKLYDKYSILKGQDETYFYLFKSGLFYIFIAEDAVKMSPVLNLKCTKLTDELYKCGFPVNSLDKYMQKIKEQNIKVTIIENDQVINYDNVYLNNVKLLELIRKLKKIDINNTTPIESFKILKNLKELIDNE